MTLDEDKKRTFKFYSNLDSNCFLQRIQEEAKQAHLQIELAEMAFKLRIDGNHGGEVFYKAHIFVDEHGGSLIEGEIITIPWNEVENKTKFQKVMGMIGYVLGGVILSPIIILLFIILGFDELFCLFKNKGKRKLPREEKKLLDFMFNKLCCTQIMG